MSKKTPKNRADTRLSNLVLEGGRSKVYREARTGHVNGHDSDGKYVEKTVVKASPNPPDKGNRRS